jgi:hypothetical protein
LPYLPLWLKNKGDEWSWAFCRLLSALFGNKGFWLSDIGADLVKNLKRERYFSLIPLVARDIHPQTFLPLLNVSPKNASQTSSVVILSNILKKK